MKVKVKVVYIFLLLGLALVYFFLNLMVHSSLKKIEPSRREVENKRITEAKESPKTEEAEPDLVYEEIEVKDTSNFLKNLNLGINPIPPDNLRAKKIMEVSFFLAFKKKCYQELSVKKAYLHAWKSYKQYAWGKDELMPYSKRGKDMIGMGVTIVDNLDTLWLMDLKEEFKEAREFVVQMRFDQKNVQVSEATHRVLGGLISAYILTEDDLFLVKAKVLAENLLFAWKGNSTVPMPILNFRNRLTKFHSWLPEQVILSEVSLTLEFCMLSALTSEPSYCKRAVETVDSIQRKTMHGMARTPICYDSLQSGKKLTLGKDGDTYFEV